MWYFLYKQQSATQLGTLYHAKNVLKRIHVTDEPFKDFYASSDLIEDVTHAYLVAGAHHHFDIRIYNESNTEVLPDNNDPHFIMEEAKKFVLAHIDSSYPSMSMDAPRSNEYACKYCGKVYQRPKLLQKHEVSQHEHELTAFTPAADTNDHVYNYTCLFLFLALLRLEHNDGIRMGDGDRMMRVNRYLTFIYKVSKCPKYAYCMLETAAQERVLLPAGLAYELKWNRCVNLQGHSDTNFPNDKDVEHMNGYFKNEAHTYRGKLTEKTVKRISRSAGITEEIVSHYKTTAGVKSHSGKHSDSDRKQDISMLAKGLIQKDVFSVRGNRKHKGFENISRSPLKALDVEATKKWIGQSLKQFSYKSYYVKFE